MLEETSPLQKPRLMNNVKKIEASECHFHRNLSIDAWRVSSSSENGEVTRFNTYDNYILLDVHPQHSVSIRSCQTIRFSLTMQAE
jgi:hypothetical protein